ncbi:MAG: hypothetical protein AB4911_08090 [Oscillochloridaceae bacterium umkhey_bin13]
MPYTISRHPDQLLWVVMEGHLALAQAEHYFQEMWGLLDEVGSHTDLLVDGRRIAGAAMGARRRTEQIVHHPNLGHLAFVVSEHHMLLFAPLVKLVSGVGLFGNEHEAVSYLRCARGLPPMVELDASTMALSAGSGDAMIPPEQRAETLIPQHALVVVAHHQRAVGCRPLPPRPSSRLKKTPLFPGHVINDHDG